MGKGVLDPVDGAGDVRQQAPSIGVAQDQALGTLLERGPQHPQGELRVRPVAVEEVLRVKEDPPVVASQVRHRLGHHRDSVVEVGQQGFPDVVVPRLPDDAYRLGLRFEQIEHLRITLNRSAGPAGGAERGQGRGAEVEFGTRPLEKLAVLGVGAGPSALDVSDPEIVQQSGDPQLVGNGQRDAFLLRPVSQGGVVDFESGMWHASFPPSPDRRRYVPCK